MRIAYFPNQVSLNGAPVLNAFLTGCRNLGLEPVEGSFDCETAVIWSVLWHGRMAGNQRVYNHYRNLGKNVFIIEVGTLKRGVLWKISFNNINRLGTFKNEKNLNKDRLKVLGLSLKQKRHLRPKKILIASQHARSEQWAGMPNMTTWVSDTVDEIRKYTDMPIVVRPHPRHVYNLNLKDVTLDRPKKIPGTYDDFNIDYDYHCVINYNSGVAIQAAIDGTPVICDQSSLAWPMSTTFDQIENPTLPDREDWFLKLCHTEWTVDEIAKGIPIQRLLDK